MKAAGIILSLYAILSVVSAQAENSDVGTAGTAVVALCAIGGGLCGLLLAITICCCMRTVKDEKPLRATIDEEVSLLNDVIRLDKQGLVLMCAREERTNTAQIELKPIVTGTGAQKTETVLNPLYSRPGSFLQRMVVHDTRQITPTVSFVTMAGHYVKRSETGVITVSDSKRQIVIPPIIHAYQLTSPNSQTIPDSFPAPLVGSTPVPSEPLSVSQHASSVQTYSSASTVQVVVENNVDEGKGVGESDVQVSVQPVVVVQPEVVVEPSPIAETSQQQPSQTKPLAVSVPVSPSPVIVTTPSKVNPILRLDEIRSSRALDSPVHSSLSSVAHSLTTSLDSPTTGRARSPSILPVIPPTPGSLLEGHLEKKGRLGNVFRKCHGVMTADQLEFKDYDHSDASVIVPMKEISTATAIPSDDGFFRFDILTGKKPIALRARTPEERDRWLSTLLQHLSSSK